MCMGVFLLQACLYHVHRLRSKARSGGADPLGLELQRVKSRCVGSRVKPRSSERAACAPEACAIFPALDLCLMLSLAYCFIQLPLLSDAFLPLGSISIVLTLLSFPIGNK